MSRERDLAVRSQAVGDDLAKLDEAVEEDPVPGFERFLVLCGDSIHAFDLNPAAQGGGDMKSR
jgi:NDP-sugar pyrophosphorylase family protein